jgi:predicted nuclease of predicted toxin-antitoxin system
MWLLDANMPVKLVRLLKDLGVEADTAVGRGWSGLSNGALVRSAAQAQFRALLTRDRLFGESAARILRRFPDFSIIQVNLPQLRAAQFLAAFEAAWQWSPIVPVPGQTIEWPPL